MCVLFYVLLRSIWQDRIIADLLGDILMKEKRRKLKKARRIFRLWWTFRFWWRSDRWRWQGRKEDAVERTSVCWGSRKVLANLMTNPYAKVTHYTITPVTAKVCINTPTVLSYRKHVITVNELASSDEQKLALPVNYAPYSKKPEHFHSYDSMFGRILCSVYTETNHLVERLWVPLSIV